VWYRIDEQPAWNADISSSSPCCVPVELSLEIGWLCSQTSWGQTHQLPPAPLKVYQSQEALAFTLIVTIRQPQPLVHFAAPAPFCARHQRSARTPFVEAAQQQCQACAASIILTRIVHQAAFGLRQHQQQIQQLCCFTTVPIACQPGDRARVMQLAI
jgi:hypothetical protein